MYFYDPNGIKIEIHFNNMKLYIKTINDTLESKQEEFEKMVEEKAKHVHTESLDMFYDSYIDDYHRLNNIFPNFLFNNFLLGWYSFVESKLFEFCTMIYKKKELDLKYKDLSGKGIYQSYNYLKKVACLQLNENNWGELKTINKIRNDVIHRNGKINDTNRKDSNLNQYLKKHNLYLTEDFKDEILCNYAYCLHLTNLGYNLFSKLFYSANITATPDNFKIRSRNST